MSALGERLELLVPDCAAEAGDWEDVLRRSRPSRRRRAATAGLAAAGVALVAAPAFALIQHLVGRHDVTFGRAPSAPSIVKKEFFDLGLGAPPRWSLHVVAGQTRRVGTLSVHGRRATLWVAPTKAGGYCYQLDLAGGGCRRDRAERGRALSAGWQTASPDVALPSFVSGDIAAARATRLVARYQDGSSASIPFIFVSKPIAAGFFAFDIPLDHRRRGHALRELALLDSRGRTIARQTFDLRPPPIRPQPRSAAQRHPQRLPTTLPLRAPLQTGSADGVFVTVGANDVAVFRVRALDAERRRLLQRGASYGCFQIVRVFGFLEARGLGVEGAFAPVAAAGIYGVGEPVDGCDIEGTNGHRWPDVLRSHSPVEIPLTARGRRWFADRAAARDLALFVRSRQGHAFRHEQGSAVANAIHAFGRSRVVATTSPSAGLIGFTLTPHGVVLVETSETGHRFRVEIRNGRIVRQNLKPYAFVF